MKRVWLAMMVALACVGGVPAQAMSNPLDMPTGTFQTAAVTAHAETLSALDALADKWEVKMGRHHYYWFLSDTDKEQTYEDGYRLADMFVDELEARVHFFYDRHHWSDDTYAWHHLKELAQTMRKGMPKAKEDHQERVFAETTLDEALAGTEDTELKYFMEEAVWFAAKSAKRHFDRKYEENYSKSVFQ